VSEAPQPQRGEDNTLDVIVPGCIPGCTADHTTQPVGLRECAASDSVGAVRGTVTGMTPAYVSTSRWQDPDGVGGEVVIHPPQRADEPAEPSTYTPAHARTLAALLIDAAQLVDTRR
jgi:hypothetical protein